MTATSDAAAPAVLPSVELIIAPTVTLGVVAIAAGVFALVLSLLSLYVPSEAMWLLVLVLTAKRRRLMEEGLDLVLVTGRPSRSKRHTQVVVRG